MARKRSITYELKLKNIVMLLYGLANGECAPGVFISPVLTGMLNSSVKAYNRCDWDFLNAHFAGIFNNLPGFWEAVTEKETRYAFLSDIYGRPQGSRLNAGSVTFRKEFVKLILNSKTGNGEYQAINAIYQCSLNILNMWDTSGFGIKVGGFIANVKDAEEQEYIRTNRISPEILDILIKYVGDRLAEGGNEAYAKALTWMLLAAYTRGDFSDLCKIIKESEPVQDGHIVGRGHESSISRRYRHISPISGNQYADRPYIIEAIDNAFQTDRVIFLSGISGSGKTEICRYYGMIRLGDNSLAQVISLDLDDKGSGTLADILEKIEFSSDKPLSDEGKKTILYELEDDDLIIINNYNDVRNSIVYDLLNLIPEARFLITTQSTSEEMTTCGRVLYINEMDALNPEARDAFAENLFCSYAGRELQKLSDDEKEELSEVIRCLGYHPFIIGILGRQYKKQSISLHTLHKKICHDMRVALSTELKVSINKDGMIHADTPYNLLKELFEERIVFHDFSEMERQVLGAIILCEEYTDDIYLICELTGDSDALNLYKARNAAEDLKEQGILQIISSHVYLHPLIKALVTDSTLKNRNNETIAILSEEFYGHLMRNKLQENYSIRKPESLNGKRMRAAGKILWYTWVLDFLHMWLLPELRTKDKELDAALAQKSYFVGLCKGKNGAAIYLKFSSGEEYCVIDGTRQNIADYRYFPAENKTPLKEYVRCHLYEFVHHEENTVAIPETVAGAPISFLGRGLFFENQFLEEVVLPSGLICIADYCFCHCENLKRLIIPDQVTYIGVRAFSNCTRLNYIKFGSSVRNISISAFANCSSLNQELVFPASLHSINRYAFFGCGEVTAVTFPDTENQIHLGAFCFNGCKSIHKINFGKGVRVISHAAFSGCASLEELVIPSSVFSIEEHAFSKCNSLKKVVIQEGLQRIMNNAFCHCKTLSSINLPASVREIVEDPFSDCPEVEVSTVEGSYAYFRIKHYSVLKEVYTAHMYRKGRKR